jgi:hypothetical protein
MKHRSLIMAAFISGAVFLLQADGWAQQNRSTGGSTGSTSGRTTGGSSSTTSASGRSVGGSLSAGQRTLTGSGARGGAAGGQGGFGNIGTMNEQQVSQAGQLSNSERFVRDNRQAGQFVGADTGDTQNFLSALTSGRAMSSIQGLQQRQQTFNPNTAGQEDNQRKYRIQVQVAFDHPAPSTPALTVNLQRQLGPTSQLRSLGPIRVEIQGRTAILSGTVATEHMRALAEKLALLEPGISEVRNELTVSAAPAALAPVAERPLP